MRKVKDNGCDCSPQKKSYKKELLRGECVNKKTIINIT